MGFANWILRVLLGLSGAFAIASVEDGPVGFKIWKDTQFVEAKNRVARLSNQLTIIKRKQASSLLESKEEVGDGDPMPDQAQAKSESLLQFEKSQIESLQKDLQLALENLQFVTELTIEDYFAVYLSKFVEDSEAIEKVAKDLSQAEVEQLLKLILKKNLDDALKIQTLRITPSEQDPNQVPL